jgi:hypothetical protein
MSSLRSTLPYIPGSPAVIGRERPEVSALREEVALVNLLVEQLLCVARLDSAVLLGVASRVDLRQVAEEGSAPGRIWRWVVHPRRLTVAQRLQTNATLAAFEDADLFANVSDICPMFASISAIT